MNTSGMETTKQQGTELTNGARLDFGHLHESELIKPWVINYRKVVDEIETETAEAVVTGASLENEAPTNVVEFAPYYARKTLQMRDDEAKIVSLWQDEAA